MKAQKVTLEDIALKVGVTKMTVSRYLKSPDKVAAKTAEKIRAAIEETGYVLNRAPVMLAQSSSKTIGLAVSAFSNILFSDLIEGVEQQADKYGYEVLITHTSYRSETEERKIMQLLSYQVDAVILTDPVHTTLTVRRLRSAAIPVVELMSFSEKPLDMNIGYNHKKVAYAAVKGLIRSGRRNIAYFRARMDFRTLQRQAGIEAACREAGIVPHILGSDAHSDFSCGAEMLRKAVREIPDLDAVLCTNDDVAVGAMIACHELGIKIPEQVSLLGYNGLNIASATVPKITSVGTARHDMGVMAVDMIMQRLIPNNVSVHNNEQHVELFPMLTLGETLRSNEHQEISRLFDTLYAVKLPKDC